MFDPTPTCDAIDGVISLLRGDYAGDAISVLSMVPYVGNRRASGASQEGLGVTSAV